jgi:hypothetical protein
MRHSAVPGLVRVTGGGGGWPQSIVTGSGWRIRCAGRSGPTLRRLVQYVDSGACAGRSAMADHTTPTRSDHIYPTIRIVCLLMVHQGKWWPCQAGELAR